MIEVKSRQLIFRNHQLETAFCFVRDGVGWEWGGLEVGVGGERLHTFEDEYDTPCREECDLHGVILIVKSPFCYSYRRPQ